MWDLLFTEINKKEAAIKNYFWQTVRTLSQSNLFVDFNLSLALYIGFIYVLV